METTIKNQSEQNVLGHEKIWKLLIKFSVPAIIGMVVNMLYTVIDRIYIGKIPDVGGLAITGVGITMPITIIISAIGMLVGIGTSANISICLGANDKNKAQRTLSTGFILVIIASLCIMVFGNLFATPIIHLFGGTDNTTYYALEYLRPLLWGPLFNLIAFSLNTSISSDGNPKIAMTTMIIGAIINIVLDPIFIFGFGLGIKGAAYATVLSQMVASIWVLYYFAKSKKANLHLRKSTICFDKKISKTILAVGLAPCLMQVASSCVQVICNNALLKHGGDMAIGAMAVIASLCAVFIMPIFGLNQGVQPIIGFNYGAKKYTRVKQAYYLGLICCTIILTVSYIVIFFFPEACISLFNEDPELTNIAVSGIRLYLCGLPLIGVQMSASNYFQATARPKKSMLIGLTRQVLFLIPALIIFPMFLGLTGVWAAGVFGDILSVVVSLFIILKEMKRLNKLSETV